jgi:hypothetical protein
MRVDSAGLWFGVSNALLGGTPLHLLGGRRRPLAVGRQVPQEMSGGAMDLYLDAEWRTQSLARTAIWGYLGGLWARGVGA